MLRRSAERLPNLDKVFILANTSTYYELSSALPAFTTINALYVETLAY